MASKALKAVGETVEQVLDEIDAKRNDPGRDYEAWRPALIAFYRAQGPWFMSIEQLERGAPLSTDNKHDIDGLMAALAAVRLRRAA